MNELTIAKKENALTKKENVLTIVDAAPQAFSDNQVSRQRCEAAGNALLEEIAAQGMSDALDQKAEAFIRKAKNTLRVMNERRAPVTKLFDQIRAEYTALENAIDPAKGGTVTAKLQTLRNEYAKRKREEEQRKLLEIQRRQQIEQARSRYRADVEQDYRQQFNSFMASLVNTMVEIDRNVTLDTIGMAEDTLRSYSEKMPEEHIAAFRCGVRVPAELTLEETREIQKTVLAALRPKFEEQYTFEVTTNRDDILDRLPSKKANLERAAKASAEEAERIKAEMAAREAAEARMREDERREREETERKAQEMARQQAEMGDLFNAASGTVMDYQPKVKVTKKINALNAEAFPKIFMMWWLEEGCRLTVEELAKAFKKQVAFCERLANKEGKFIEDENIEYVDDVKAK